MLAPALATLQHDLAAQEVKSLDASSAFVQGADTSITDVLGLGTQREQREAGVRQQDSSMHARAKSAAGGKPLLSSPVGRAGSSQFTCSMPHSLIKPCPPKHCMPRLAASQPNSVMNPVASSAPCQQPQTETQSSKRNSNIMQRKTQMGSRLRLA